MNGGQDWFTRAVNMRNFNAMYPRSQNKPSGQRVIWLSDRPGNGLCIPKDKALSEWMTQRYGFDGVAYAHGEPDFEPFVETIRPEDLMSSDFEAYRREYRSRKNPGVFCDTGQAVRCQFSLEDTISTDRGVNENYCFDRIAEAMGGNVNRQVVDDYFSYRELTCHEPSDLHTLQIIPTRINKEFSHTAGISTARHSEAFLDGPAAESEDNGVKVLRRSMDDSPYRSHGDPYGEVYDSHALPFDSPLTQQELDHAYRRDQVYVDGLQEIYGDGYAPRDNNVTKDYATLRSDLDNGYMTTSEALAAGDGGQYIEGFNQFNEAHQQINTDMDMTRMLQQQAVDQQYGADATYDQGQDSNQDQQVDQLYGMEPEQEEAQGQRNDQDQQVDQLYGMEPEQEEAQGQRNDQDQQVDQLYGMEPEQEEAQGQRNDQDQQADQLYGVEPEQEEAQGQRNDQDQQVDQLYGAEPEQEEARRPDLEIDHDMTQ